MKLAVIRTLDHSVLAPAFQGVDPRAERGHQLHQRPEQFCDAGVAHGR